MEMEPRIFGVDIASRSPRSRQEPGYAIAILEGENARALQMVSRHKLIRLVREKKPDIVAIDNVHELASEREGLIALMRLFPSSTRLVQVTGGEQPESLVKVARWHGISFDRLNPTEEAEACARLAAKGVGHVLSAFEDRTRIKVSRRRSPGRGGWSQNRYRRKIHGNVKGMAREVEKRLRESGLAFSSHAVEGLGGYIRCEFTVEAPRAKVPVHSGLREDVQIRVEAIARPRLQFTPLLWRRGYVIAGIDPGTTTGVAVLDLAGDLVDLTSRRAMSPSDVIEWIAARGRPLIVATDVFPTPGAVEKIKRAFNAVLFSPGDSVPADEKILIARSFGYKNDHERDALAAAASAFKRYRNKFIIVEKKAPREVDPDEVKALVVRGYSIESAIIELSPSAAASSEAQSPESDQSIVSSVLSSPEVKTAPGASATQDRSAERQLADQVRVLKEYVEELRAEIAVKDRAVEDLSRRLDRERDRSARDARRSREVRIRVKEIQRLAGMLRVERKQMRRLLSQNAQARKAKKIEDMAGYRRCKPIDSFSKEAVIAAKARWSISKGDVVLLSDASGGGQRAADLLADIGVEAVVIEGEMPPATREYLSDQRVPVYDARELALRTIDGIVFIDPRELEAARASWEQRMAEREKEKKAEWLESMVEEYRAERRREERLEDKRKAKGAEGTQFEEGDVWK